MTRVILPVSRAVYDEIAREVVLRGQPDRVDVTGKRVDLSDVVLEWNENKMMAPPTEED